MDSTKYDWCERWYGKEGSELHNTEIIMKKYVNIAVIIRSDNLHSISTYSVINFSRMFLGLILSDHL